MEPQSAARRAAIPVGALIAGATALLAIRLMARFAFASVRRARRTARFTYRVATLTLYRRCSDCARLIHRDARVCAHCGHRRRAAA